MAANMAADMASFIHVVLFEFKPQASQDAILDTCRGMLALQANCLHPDTHKPYIRSVVGGRNLPSPGPGLADTFAYTFVVEFENERDKRYYLEEDPFHGRFADSLAASVHSVQALDFVAGQFQP